MGVKACLLTVGVFWGRLQCVCVFLLVFSGWLGLCKGLFVVCGCILEEDAVTDVYNQGVKTVLFLFLS